MEVALLEDPPSAHLGWCVCPSLPGHFPNLSRVEYRSLLTQVAGTCQLQDRGAKACSCPVQAAGVSH